MKIVNVQSESIVIFIANVIKKNVNLKGKVVIVVQKELVLKTSVLVFWRGRSVTRKYVWTVLIVR